MAPAPAWPDTLPATMHATAVACGEQGVLIVGPSGSGKSSLALSLMAYGARLISDDLTTITEDFLLARPHQARGQLQIEARGFGLLRADPSPPKTLTTVVDLSRAVTDRLPDPCYVMLADRKIACLHKVDISSFPAMVWQYLNQPTRS